MKSLASAVALLAMTGCMAPANPPSLERRAIESRADPLIDASLPVPIRPIDASLAARIAAALNEMRLGKEAFAAADRETSAAILAGAGAATGSEQWIGAEQARSALRAASQRSAAALADLDAMLLAQAQAPAGTGGYKAVAAAQSEAEQAVAQQNRRIVELTP